MVVGISVKQIGVVARHHRPVVCPLVVYRLLKFRNFGTYLDDLVVEVHVIPLLKTLVEHLLVGIWSCEAWSELRLVDAHLLLRRRRGETPHHLALVYRVPIDFFFVWVDLRYELDLELIPS